MDEKCCKTDICYFLQYVKGCSSASRWKYISGSDTDSENDMIEVAVEEKPKEKWDCESILSEYLKIGMSKLSR